MNTDTDRNSKKDNSVDKVEIAVKIVNKKVITMRRGWDKMGFRLKR